MENIKSQLEVVINALNNVEAKGLQNMSNIIGSINILQQIVSSLEESPEEE